jgi:hypothetical protein
MQASVFLCPTVRYGCEWSYPLALSADGSTGPWYILSLTPVFKPGPYIVGLVAQMTSDTTAFRTYAPVPPLIKSRYGNAEKHRDIFRSPLPVFDRIKHGS